MCPEGFTELNTEKSLCRDSELKEPVVLQLLARSELIEKLAREMRDQGMSRAAALKHARSAAREWDLIVVDPVTGGELVWVPDAEDSIFDKPVAKPKRRAVQDQRVRWPVNSLGN